MATMLGKPYIAISQEVLDAFGHDPASITGKTKRFQGWQAVEDIQTRIYRQQDTLHAFAASITEPSSELIGPNIFQDSITTLSNSLNQLEEQRSLIVAQAEQVVQALAHVKEIHTGVKVEYNEVLGHTSFKTKI